MDWLILAVSLLVILGGAELFTNGVEWIGEAFGLSEGVVGSVLAAVGTALPETLLPLVALLSGQGAGEDIGIGAILGAPFMLTTLAMVVIGVAVLVNARGGRREPELSFRHEVVRQDLAYFLVMYALAMVAGLLHSKVVDIALAVGLVGAYVWYVRKHLIDPGGGTTPAEGQGEVKPLYLWRLLRLIRRGLAAWNASVSRAAPIVQVGLSLVAIIGGARLFIDAVTGIADRFGIPPLAFTLLVAPVATELPEKFNSVLWIRRGKDTLALGNMTGAMVFQSAFPVSIGLLFTKWELAHEALFAAIVALVAGSILYLTVRLTGRLTGRLLLLQGVLYVGYVSYVITKL
jgi:cation:H+ antiporter